MKPKGFAILLAMYCFVYLVAAADSFLFIQSEYEAEIKELQTELDTRNEVYSENQKLKENMDDYSLLIQQITETLVRNDANYGLGGTSEETIFYDDKKLLSAILTDLETQRPNEWINHVGRFYDNREQVLSELPNIWPVREGEFDRITSGYGLRYSPIDKRTHLHEGVDITTNPYNGAVIATADGVVYGLWYNHPRFGRIVYLKHSNGFTTRYAHLSKITVGYREEVKRGEVIGYIGNTGSSDGAHLHYEIQKNGSAIDPVQFMLIK